MFCFSACHRCRQGRGEGIDIPTHEREIDRGILEERIVLAFLPEEQVIAIA